MENLLLIFVITFVIFFGKQNGYATVAQTFFTLYLSNKITQVMIKNEQILLTSSQAVNLIGVSLRTWYAWDQIGKIPKPINIGKKLFWKKDELLAWIDAGCPKRDNWNYSRQNYCNKKNK
jgi:predicted DNA-binding transcriptional regulator AlpA